MEQVLRQHIEKVIPLTDDEFTFVLSHFSFKTYKKHQFLLQPGENVNYSFFVILGLLKLVFTDDNARQHIVSFAMEDWWETDSYAYFTQTKATLSLECLEDTQVYCLSYHNYKSLCTGFSKMERFFLEKSNLGFSASQKRIVSFLTSSTKQRYHELIKRYPSLIQRVPKSLLAAYIGVSRETLSRLSS